MEDEAHAELGGVEVAEDDERRVRDGVDDELEAAVGALDPRVLARSSRIVE